MATPGLSESEIGKRTPTSHLLLFFALTYAITWTCFLAVARMPPERIGRGPVLLLGVFAPAMVAIFVTAKAQGESGVRALLRRVVRWRVPAQWYLFAVSYLAAIKLVIAVLVRFATGNWPRFGHEPWYVMAAAIVLSTPFQAGEEIGWRGFALPHLAARFGLARASVILGVIWACWHIPQFFIPGADTYRQSFPVFLMQVTALSVALAWLYARTGGSLLLTMLMHASGNNTKDIVPSTVVGSTKVFGLSTSVVAWLTVVLLWIAAVYFLFRMPKTITASPP